VCEFVPLIQKESLSVIDGVGIKYETDRMVKIERREDSNHRKEKEIDPLFSGIRTPFGRETSTKGQRILR